MSADERRMPGPKLRPEIRAREKRLAEIRARHADTAKRSVMTGFGNILDAQHHMDVAGSQVFKDREFLLETIDQYEALCTDLLGDIG